MTVRIVATVPLQTPPTWAVLQRRLIDDLCAATHIFRAKYATADGGLQWGGQGAQHGRDDKDDFYEAFYNWPLLYLIGGSDELLELSHHHWSGVTRQLQALGLLAREFDLGADFFHQGEGLLFFYYLCLADPADTTMQARAVRFANFYTGADPAAVNYDPATRMMLAPHTGSVGARRGFSDHAELDLPASMSVYGLPLGDLAEIVDFSDLGVPDAAARMHDAMNERFGEGDVAANLGITSLVATAYLLTGDVSYRDWVVSYTDAWHERAIANQGLLPDNVGPSGVVGEAFGGRWYGGLYGWAWPHGFYSMAQSAAIAATNALLVSGDTRHLDLCRPLLDQCIERARVIDVRGLSMSLLSHWLPMLGFQSESALRSHPQEVCALVLPYRRNDAGWFDEQPFTPSVASTVWAAGGIAEDRARLAGLRRRDPRDWRCLDGGLYKEDAGHEAPWLAFLDGDNPSYPEATLDLAAAALRRRLALIAEDRRDLSNVGKDDVHNLVHHWQKLNPVTTEALVQLTMGAPQTLYNGGLLMGRLRYFDADRRRPGLPVDVAALVSEIEGDLTVVTLVNLDTTATRTVVVQAGSFAQHRFVHAAYDRKTGSWPGELGAYLPPQVGAQQEETALDGCHVQVELAPSSRITLRLRMALNSATPTCYGPFDQHRSVS